MENYQCSFCFHVKLQHGYMQILYYQEPEVHLSLSELIAYKDFYVECLRTIFKKKSMLATQFVCCLDMELKCPCSIGC